MSDEFEYNKLACASNKGFVHLGFRTLTFFDTISRPYRVCSTLDLDRSLDFRGKLLWSSSLKHLIYCDEHVGRSAVFHLSGGTLTQGSNAFFSRFGHGVPHTIAWHPSRDILAFTGWSSRANSAILGGFDFDTGEFAFERLLSHSDAAWSLAWSATGQLIATASRDGSVIILDLMTSEERALFDHGEPVYRAEFSPDGQRLATFSQKTVIIWNPRTGEKVANWPADPSSNVRGMVWSPDASMIASVNGGVLQVHRLGV
jgi:WD40 repeat protein